MKKWILGAAVAVSVVAAQTLDGRNPNDQTVLYRAELLHSELDALVGHFRAFIVRCA